MDKQKTQQRQLEILDLVRQFCGKKLDNEYFDLAEKLTAKLGRKRNVPSMTGQPKIWAAAIIHALALSISYLTRHLNLLFQ